MSAFYDPASFAFVSTLERAFGAIRTEWRQLDEGEFIEAPDSLTTVADGFDETGWRYFDLFGKDGQFEEHRKRCPRTADACLAVPGLVNAGFSLFRPGTHLYPHRGEMSDVLRCHLPLQLPEHDAEVLGLRIRGEVRQWELGHCLIFDDRHEHEAWNHSREDRVVLLVTFAHAK